MIALFVLVGAVAAWRLADTPLAVPALAFALGTIVSALVRFGVEARSGDRAPRWLVALGHVCGAMSGFFLFVSMVLK